MGDRSSVTFVTTEEGNERLIQECDKLNDERGITYPLLGSPSSLKSFLTRKASSFSVGLI